MGEYNHVWSDGKDAALDLKFSRRPLGQGRPPPQATPWPTPTTARRREAPESYCEGIVFISLVAGSLSGAPPHGGGAGEEASEGGVHEDGAREVGGIQQPPVI